MAPKPEINKQLEMLKCIIMIQEAFRDFDIKKLREITNKCEKNILIEEHLFFSLALLSYTLSKILQKSRYKNERFYQSITIQLSRAVQFAKNGDEVSLVGAIEKILDIIVTYDENEKRYIISLIEKGRTKIAASLYAQGLSLSRVITITGAQKQEVLDYSGKTVMSDRAGKTISVKDRLRNAKEILKD
jgi:hypothetical protein